MAKGSRHICGNPNALALRHDGQAWCRPWHPRRPDSVHTAWYSPHSDGPASVPRSGARCLRMHAIASCPSSSSTQVTKNRNTCHPNATFTTLRRSPVDGSRSSPPRVWMPLAACAPTCKASILDHAALLVESPKLLAMPLAFRVARAQRDGIRASLDAALDAGVPLSWHSAHVESSTSNTQPASSS